MMYYNCNIYFSFHQLLWIIVKYFATLSLRIERKVAFKKKRLNMKNVNQTPKRYNTEFYCIRSDKILIPYFEK